MSRGRFLELDSSAHWLRQLREAGIDVPVLVESRWVATPTEAELLERVPFVAPPPDLPARLGRDPGAGIALGVSSASGELRRACGMASIQDG